MICFIFVVSYVLTCSSFHSTYHQMKMIQKCTTLSLTRINFGVYEFVMYCEILFWKWFVADWAKLMSLYTKLCLDIMCWPLILSFGSQYYLDEIAKTCEEHYYAILKCILTNINNNIICCPWIHVPKLVFWHSWR